MGTDMKVELTANGPELSELDIARFEKSLGAVLPAAYSAFLRQHNGGCPNDFRFFRVDPRDGDIESSVQTFLGVARREDIDNIDWVLEITSDRLPPDVIPIASTDADSDLICISIAAHDLGSIYFWDSRGSGAAQTRQDLYRVASSIDEFLSGLYEYIPADESEMDRIIRENDADALERYISEGGDVNAQDEYGNSLIETAVVQNRPKLIQLLHGGGAEARSSLAIAQENLELFGEHAEVVDLLRHLYRIGKESE